MGNGSKINFWTKLWIPLLNSCRPITTPPQRLSCWPISLFIDGDRWNIPFLEQILLPIDVDIILRIPLSGDPCYDELVWHFEAAIAYLVKSGYKLAFSLLNDCSCLGASVEFVWWRKLWLLKIPSKVKICLWRAFLDAFLTWEALAKRQVCYQVYYPWCFESP